MSLRRLWSLTLTYNNRLEFFVGAVVVGPRIGFDELLDCLLDAPVGQNYVRPYLLACDWAEVVVFLLQATFTVLQVVGGALSVDLEVPQDVGLLVGLAALDHDWDFVGGVGDGAE